MKLQGSDSSMSSPLGVLMAQHSSDTEARGEVGGGRGRVRRRKARPRVGQRRVQARAHHRVLSSALSTIRVTIP